MVFNLSETNTGGGGVTDVSFGEYAAANIQSGFVSYLDGNGAVQRSTTGFDNETTVSMMSGSVLTVVDNMDMGMTGTWNALYITGMTPIYDGSVTIAPRTKAYYRIYQVD